MTLTTNTMGLDREFSLREDVIYLNHAAVSPWPRRTARAVARFAEENAVQGSLDYPKWLETEKRLREQVRQLLNAESAGDIALVKNTSEGLSLVAYGLDWSPGDNVVASDQEFPSNRIVWQSLADQGVEFRAADLTRGESPEQALLERIDENTRLLAISSIQYATGLRMDLEVLGRFCRERNILFCVDAIQSLGAVPVDTRVAYIDFLAADGHKWMLGPEGLGIFYARPEARERLKLRQFGWHMVENVGDFERSDWEAAQSARRFECGSPNMLGIHALQASLSLLFDYGLEQVENAVLERSQRLMEGIEDQPQLELITPSDSNRHGGIVTVRHKRIDEAELFERMKAEGIFCARRGGGIRLSPHFYTPLEHLDRAVELLRSPDSRSGVRRG